MPTAQDASIAIVIPAYKPSAGLVDLVEALTQASRAPIVIVDDGSGPEFRDVFARVAACPSVELLRHAVNLGKGAALKTAMNWVLCQLPHAVGIVTADADGQHHPEDILAVAAALNARPSALVLGSREFGRDVPLRSRLGNVLTRGIMHALLGRKLTDTQTGLRGIPATLLPGLLRLETTGYEFELQMLIRAHELEIPIVEIPIRTIYEAGNKSSHFNPIVDSMKIYFVLLRFGSVSFLTALLDNLVFWLAWRRSGNVLLSQVLARIVAVAFNYSMVRRKVFYSKQQHKSVLPKYLMLVLASGTASYAGIRFLSGQLGVATVPAKLLVETLLFFVNFAIQRLFIFRPQEGSAGVRRTTPTLVFTGLVALVFALLVALEVHGFRTANLFHQQLWYPSGARRFARCTGIFGALAAPLLLLVPWTFASVLAVLLVVLSVVAVGPLAVLAPAFFLVSASALGSKVLGRGKDSLQHQLVAALLGMGIYMFAMTFLARLPLHYPAAWAVVLAIPIALDFRGVRERAAGWLSLLRNAELRRWRERAAFALLAFLVVAHWFVVLKPETSADGLAMHLAAPMDIALHHRFTFEPARFLWSVMPMGADWAYSIVFLLGGEPGARFLNFAMLLAVLALLHEAARRWVTPAAALLIAASFAALPLVQFVTGSLMVENFLAAALLALVTAIWLFGDTGRRRYLYLAAALAGMALNIKLGALPSVLLALPFLAGEVAAHWKSLGRRPAAVCALAAVILLATALPTYAIAWQKTGNPIFPFQNERFHSRILDPTVSVDDLRYRNPLDWATLYSLTFDTAKSYEGQNGSFGFQFLVVAPLAALGLLVVTRRPVPLAAVMALGAAIAVLRTQPNVRYLYPVMALILVAFSGVLGWLRSNERHIYRVLVGYLAAATALNIWFLPTASYYHKDFSLRLPFSRAERVNYRRIEIPVREVIAYFNQHHGGSPVLIAAGPPFIAGIQGEVYLNHWHQYPTLAELRGVPSVPEMMKLIQSWKVAEIILPKPSADEPVSPLVLRSFIGKCTAPEYELGDYYLARLVPDCAAARTWNGPEQPTIVAHRGYYDDFDPTIVYRGEWEHDQSFDRTFRHTISYTDLPGAEIAFAFEGESVTWIYTEAPNRGIAAITVDGKDQGTLDLYQPAIHWQALKKLCCFGPGRHDVVIRVTGRRSPGSTGKFVDLDGFNVW